MKVQIIVVTGVLKRRGQEKSSILESEGLGAKMVVSNGGVKDESQNHSGRSRRYFFLCSIFVTLKDS